MLGCGSSNQPAVSDAVREKLKNAKIEPRNLATIPGATSFAAGSPAHASVDPVRRFAVRPFEEWTMRETAAAALGRIGQPAVPQLVEALTSPNPTLRHQAADTLARIGPSAKDAVPALVKAMEDQDPTVRKAAARALGQIGPDAADAVPQLIEMLLEDDRNAAGQPMPKPTEN